MSASVVVIGGGDQISPRELAALPAEPTIIAADSGIDRAAEVDLEVDIGIGDFDSVSGQGYLRAEAAGVDLIRYPANKNATDLELAMVHAMSLDPDRLVVTALAGGRFDHLIANVLLLGDQRFSSVEIDAFVGDQRLSIINDRRVLTGQIGSLVSLLPLGGPAVGITTIGLEYGLDNETLVAGSPRGMSNVLVGPLAVVSLLSGTLLAFQELPA